jgi:hypothetical protein
VCNAPRAAEALGIAQRHHAACRHTLASRLADIERADERAGQAHRDAVARRTSEFSRNWGPKGRERLRLREAIASSSALTRHALRDALDPGGPGATALAERIDAVQTAEEANRLGQELAADVVTLAMDEWARGAELHRARCAEVMEPFLRASEELVAGADFGAIHLRRSGELARTEDHVYDRIRGSVGYSMPMLAASSIVISMIASPLALAAAAGGVLWALSRGWRVSSDAKGKAARVELHKHLRELLAQVTRHFFAVDLKRSQVSRVDEYLKGVEASLEARIDLVAAEREKEAERELALLTGQANLGAKAREKAAAGHRAALEKWDALGEDLARLLADDRARAHLGSLGD